MSTSLDVLNQAGSKKIRLMTHIVAGYPDYAKSLETARLMAKYADAIEIQIPFSDPMADGPTIMRANQTALQAGISTEDCFRLAQTLIKECTIPVLFMSYANIPFHTGMEKFISRCAAIGIAGLIIPDIPFDSNNYGYFEISVKHNVAPVYVVSPDTSADRLSKIVPFLRGMVYTTLKVGITGAGTVINESGMQFLGTIRRYTPLPVAAGFGISSVPQILSLTGKADIAIVGSRLIDIYDQSGLAGVKDFLDEYRKGT